MSNFGTIYEINLKTRMKNLYPVVYENEKYYVCKVHGCSDIRTFPKASSWSEASWSAVTYETFKKFYEYDKYTIWKNRIFVYVKTREHACFKPCIEMTAEEHRLEILDRNLNEAKNTLNRTIANLKYNEKCVENAKERVKTLEKEKANIEKIMQEKKLKKEN